MRVALVACALAIPCCAACHDDTRAPDAGDAAPSTDASKGTERRTPLEAGASHRDLGDAGSHKCRIMDSENGPAPTASPDTWITMPASSTFNVRTFETGRELRFVGPGRVKPCGQDVALVAEGAALGQSGSGEAPGSEQWVATACGAARWPSGAHRVTGGRNECMLHASTGALNLWVASDIVVEEIVDGGAPDATAPLPRGTEPWHRVATRHDLRLHPIHGTLDTPAAAKAALTECDAAATMVDTIAKSLTAGDAGSDGGSMGDLAAQSVSIRGVARAACAVAAVRVTLAGDKPDDLARLEAANTRFRGSSR